MMALTLLRHWMFAGATAAMLGAPTAGRPLGVGASGHYVTHQGRAVMLIGDSGTQVVLMNGDLDMRAWLDACKREGHSTVHVWSFTGPKPGDWRLGARMPLLPWARRTDGTLDLLQFDEGRDPARHYWPRVRELCRLARDRGLLVGITVFFGWAKDHGPSPGWPDHPLNRARGGPAQTPSDVVEVFADREIGVEEWSDAWPARRKCQWLWERFAEKLIRETKPLGNVWYDYRDEWSYLNAEAARSEAFWRRFFVARGCLWADRSGEGGLRAANPDVPGWGPTPAIKTEGGPYDHEGVRAEVWRRAMAGVHYLLHDDAREPNIASWDPGVAISRGVRPSDDLGRRYVGLCSRFFNRSMRDLRSLAPAPERVERPALCMAGRRELVVYVSPGHGEVPVNLAGYVGAGRARFYDPRSGRWLPARPDRRGAVAVFTVPDIERDWALHIAVR